MHYFFRTTNEDGRMGHFIDCEKFLEGVYKMVFNTKPYFEAQNVTTFYPYVEVNDLILFCRSITNSCRQYMILKFNRNHSERNIKFKVNIYIVMQFDIWSKYKVWIWCLIVKSCRSKNIDNSLYMLTYFHFRLCLKLKTMHLITTSHCCLVHMDIPHTEDHKKWKMNVAKNNKPPSIIQT